VIIASDIDALYKEILSDILKNGITVTARGLVFKEVRFQHYILTNPRARVIQNPTRKMVKRFAMAEFIWMMSGKKDVESISFYNKNIAQFSDNGIVLRGAYGPRLRNWRGNDIISGTDQLRNCMDKLKKDLYTRQAVVIILDPLLDLVTPTKDVPCNDLLHFMVREGRLDLACYVRSNDSLLGFPYDVFHWTMLQEIFACELGVEVGEYHHFVGSMHIYDKDESHMYNIKDTSVVHVPMTPMPKDTDLNVIERLAEFEKVNRGILRTNSLPLNGWWVEKANWIVKK
jgi:thymidylate synthase